tara:strand:- start:1146 stop:1577 length:432 start_codon:yes stop_codon:yes gene_type:complete
MEVKRTERGWPGHYIRAFYCVFRRNTLLECGDVRIIASTVGAQREVLCPKCDNVPFKQESEVGPIGSNRHYETLAFHAQVEQEIYLDVDVERQVSFITTGCVEDISEDSDMRANDMHEAVVMELTRRLEAGETFSPPDPDEDE